MKRWQQHSARACALVLAGSATVMWLGSDGPGAGKRAEPSAGWPLAANSTRAPGPSLALPAAGGTGRGPKSPQLPPESSAVRGLPPAGWARTSVPTAPPPDRPASAPAPAPVEARLVTGASPYLNSRSELRILFSRPIPNRVRAESALTLDPTVTGTLSWPDGRTVRFQPDRLAFGTTYRLRLQVPLAGTPENGWEWTVTTLKALTLTFDDCPVDAQQLSSLLAVLREKAVKATMFPTGNCATKFPNLVAALRAEGHTVCNHTLSHPHLLRLTDAQIAAQIGGGVHAGCDLFRPPYGEWDGPGGRVQRIAAQQGYRVQLWDVDTLDWSGRSSAAIIQSIYDGGGGVVLMHMQAPHTVEALRQLDLAALVG